VKWKRCPVGWKASVSVLLLSVLFITCNQPFDPRGALDRSMVVFSVLSTDRSMQFVRVDQSYMPVVYDPLSVTSDNPVTDARVYIRAINGVYPLTDTSLMRQDTSRYKSPMKLFVLNPFRPRSGETYEVVVQSVFYGPASSSVIVPGSSTIVLSDEGGQILDHPEQRAKSQQISFSIQMTGVSRGYVGKLLLYYDVLKSTGWVEERCEVPLTSADSSNFTMEYAVYPQLKSTPPTSLATEFFKNGFYQSTINVVNSRYSSNRVLFKWATFVVLQADKNLFEYFASTHASYDPYSTRLDEPLVSSLNGGIGFVGAYSVDSLVRLLPENFWGNR